MSVLKYSLIFGLLTLMSFHNEQDYETISWNVNAPLTWNDFKGEAPERARAAATTASGITYRFSTNSTQNVDVVEIDFEVSTYFYPNKSWYKPELCDDVILGHEQLHFDISELFARKLRERLKNTRFTKNVKTEIKTIYKDVLEELSDFQDNYDEETNYSRNHEQQLIWNEKIADALN